MRVWDKQLKMCGAMSGIWDRVDCDQRMAGSQVLPLAPLAPLALWVAAEPPGILELLDTLELSRFHRKSRCFGLDGLACAAKSTPESQQAGSRVLVNQPPPSASISTSASCSFHRG